MTGAVAALFLLGSAAQSFQFLFLVDGPRKGSVPKAEVAELQKQHLEHLESLWKSDRAVAVGPLLNVPRLRGIVVFRAESARDARAFMADDPWVQSGEMATEVLTWKTSPSFFAKQSAFMELGTFWLGFVRKKSGIPPRVSPAELSQWQSAHQSNLADLHREGKILAFGAIESGEKVIEIVVAPHLPVANRESLFAQDPMVTGGQLKVDWMEWMTSKGNFAGVGPAE